MTPETSGHVDDGFIFVCPRLGNVLCEGWNVWTCRKEVIQVSLVSFMCYHLILFFLVCLFSFGLSGYIGCPVRENQTLRSWCYTVTYHNAGGNIYKNVYVASFHFFHSCIIFFTSIHLCISHVQSFQRTGQTLGRPSWRAWCFSWSTWEWRWWSNPKERSCLQLLWRG